MVSNGRSCAWGVITPGKIDRSRENRLERPFYVRSTVVSAEEMLNAARAAARGITPLEKVIESPTASFTLVFETGVSAQVVGINTSMFLSRLLDLIDTYQAGSAVIRRGYRHVTDSETREAYATCSLPGW